MSPRGVEVDQRDLPPGWHLKAVLAAAVVLGLVLALAMKAFLN
jgi:hypothetical protein